MDDRTNGSPTGTGGGARSPDGRAAPEGQAGGARTPGNQTPGAQSRSEASGTQASKAGRTRAEERIANLGAPGSLEAEVERLRTELARAEQDAADARAGWQRAAADFQNYRRRAEQEKAERMGLANDVLLLKVLALADDFDLAIEHVPAEAQGSPWVEGIIAIDRKLRQLLESEGVTTMRTVGEPFDPHEHEAISHEDATDVPDGTVLRELQRGYRVRDRVLRPALVAVARNEQPR